MSIATRKLADENVLYFVDVTDECMKFLKGGENMTLNAIHGLVVLRRATHK